MSLRVCIEPSFDVDRTGGVARVVEAQRRFLPQFDIELVDNPLGPRTQIYIGHAGNVTSRDDIPRVQCCHGLYWTEPPYKWPKWATIRNGEIARALVEADMIVTPSEWVADIIRRDLWAPVNVVPNGIDPELIDSPVIASPSSYVYWNKARIDAVCEIGSLTELAKRSPGRQFVVTVPAVRPLPNVTSIGVVPYSQAIAAMRNASIYLATTREVFGVSVLEALACGVPLLGYAWGGQREQMGLPDDGGTRPEGILVPPGNIDLLTDALSRMTNPSVWRSMSEAAKERSRAYNWQTIMESFAADLHGLWNRWDGHRPAYSPEVSVVIPCYNMKRWLRGCLASLASQKTPPPFEVIIVDDASTDGSYEEAKRLAEEAGFECRVLRHPSNRYLADALNTGIHEARGKWIVNLDPDNELPPLALRDLNRAAARHPELDVVYGLMQIIKPDGSVDARWPNGIATYPPLVYNYEEQMRHENQVHSSAMFRRRMWERSGGYRQYAFAGDPPTRLNSDAEFWTRCGALGFRFGRVIEDPTLRYRLLAESMSHTVPEWDWTEPSPRHPCVTLGAPGGRLHTHEPIQISVIVDGYFPEALVESLWPQTFDRWECLVVLPPGVFLPPYAKRVMSEEDALAQARGKWKLKLNSASISRLEPEALEAFYTAHASDPAGLYDVEDSSLEGKVIMPCGGCGGGMRVTRRPGPPISSQQSRSQNVGAATAPPPPVARRLMPNQAGTSGRMTFVEFTGSGFRTRYMHRVDQRTRQRFQYIFGNEPDHRRVLVHVEDLTELVQNTQYREVSREELTEKELEALDAINEAADAAARVPAAISPTVTISPAMGRMRTSPGEGQELLRV